MQQKRPLQKQFEYQKRLNQIAYKIHSAKDTDHILVHLQEKILELFDAERITLYVAEHSKNEILSKFKTGDEIKEIRVPMDHHSIAGYCAVSGKIINIRDAYDQSEIHQISSELHFDKRWDQVTGYRTVQLLVAPIFQNRVLQGVIQLVNKKQGAHFTDEDKASLQDLAKILGLAFHKNLKIVDRKKAERFDFLIEQNIVGKNEMALVMARSRKRNATVESVLINDFNVSKEDVGKALAEFHRTRFIPFDKDMAVPDALLKGLRPGFMKKNGFFPVGYSDNGVIVAMENPSSLPARDAVKQHVPAGKFIYCVSLREDIHQMIDLFLKENPVDSQASGNSIEEILSRLKHMDQEEEIDMGAMGENDSIIVQLVNKMIVDAHHRGASDIHIEPRPGNRPVIVRMRTDGACKVYQTIPHTYKRAMVSRIKIMADLDIAEKRLPQDGKIKFSRFDPLDIELRVATVPTAERNEDVVMRILKPGKPTPLQDLGMVKKDHDSFIHMITNPYGLVLVVGPTGSGKTTTLHSALHYINRMETKIWTAEDPVEITQEGLRQVQVHPKIGLTFAAAMRSFLRADPDIIMVGEMRDRETMSMAIEASLTGHLVLSTLHTNTAPETVVRLLDMGMDPFNFADALLGVLSQRLVRTLCHHCRESYHPDATEFDTLSGMYGDGFSSLGLDHHRDLLLFRAKGCPRCSHSGYLGRTAIFEVLRGTDALRLLIQKRAPVNELRYQAQNKDQMTTLMQDGIRKVLMGVTDIKEVRKVCIR